MIKVWIWLILKECFMKIKGMLFIFVVIMGIVVILVMVWDENLMYCFGDVVGWYKVFVVVCGGLFVDVIEVEVV